ncbi:MAG: efflux RND transporter periplasmic adaptor subunit [Pseudomonadota bacterium]
MAWRLYRLACIGLVVVATALPMSRSLAQQGPASVVVAAVEEREIADTAPVIASLVGTVESLVAARAAGVVLDVGFQTGNWVDAGETLARLDDQLFQIQLTNAEAALEAARASVEVAEARARLSEQALQRAAGLKGSVAFSRGSFEDLEEQAAEARSEIARAQAQVGVAKAAVARASYDLEHAVVAAPFSGVVVERMAQPGQYIGLGDPVARLLDITRLEIEAEIPVDLVRGIAPGRELSATFDGGYTATAVVRTLLPVETTSTRTRAVRLSIVGDMPETASATGRAVTLRVPISASRRAPVVPKDALVYQGTGWMVFVAEDGTAMPRSVTIGQSAAAYIEVISGVSVGDLVVVRGNERLRPGQPVAPRLMDEASEPETTAKEVPAAPADAELEPSETDQNAEAPIVPSGSAAAATPAAAAADGS